MTAQSTLVAMSSPGEAEVDQAPGTAFARPDRCVRFPPAQLLRLGDETPPGIHS